MVKFNSNRPKVGGTGETPIKRGPSTSKLKAKEVSKAEQIGVAELHPDQVTRDSNLQTPPDTKRLEQQVASSLQELGARFYGTDTTGAAATLTRFTGVQIDGGALDQDRVRMQATSFRRAIPGLSDQAAQALVKDLSAVISSAA